jgi:hypothetical protein
MRIKSALVLGRPGGTALDLNTFASYAVTSAATTAVA